MLKESVIKRDERALLALRSLYKSFGYQPFKMSKFEEYDLYVSNKDFLVSDRVITFNDTDGKLLALKPDVTLSIIKNANNGNFDKHKVYYNENVYRVSATTGQFKEIMQAGLECIGDIDILDVFEVVSLAAESLKTVSEDYVLDISHMGIVTAILADASQNSDFIKRAGSLIAEKNIHEIKALCEQYSIADDAAEKLASIVGMYGERASVLKRLKPLCTTKELEIAYLELELLDNLLSDVDPEGRVHFDFSVVNNMKYYNGIVFKGFISGICDGVLAGGEYDNLLYSMKQDKRGIGFALYLDLVAELDSSADEYDVDVLLLYSESTDPKDIVKSKKELTESGKTVYSASIIPEKIRYKQLIKVN